MEGASGCAGPWTTEFRFSPFTQKGADLKIALVTTFYPPYNFGGDGLYVQRFAQALAARGHDVEVIHDTDGYRSISGQDPADKAPTKDGNITIHRLRSSTPKWSALKVHQIGRPTDHREEIERILSDRFDVIHYHNVSLVGGPGVWALGSAPVKLHTAHEHWLVCESHVLWRYNRELCDERHCLKCVLSFKRPPQPWRQTRHLERSAKHVDAFLTLSQSAADNHKRFGFPLDMTVVPSFLPDQETIAYGPNPRERPFFLFVGRLEKIKGVDELIEAFKGGIDADLLIAGAGEEKEALQAQAAGAPNIQFLGHMSLAELRTLYKHARALLTPSLCYEVFPLVVLEGFREGAPIIARDLGPYPEIINETGAGLLFDDVASLRQAVTQLIDSPEQAAAMGQKGLAAFNERWSEGASLQVYFDLIADISAKKSARASATA